MKNIRCSIFGHKYKLVRKITNEIREVECTRCKKQFGINDNVKCILEMDDELRDAHSFLNFITDKDRVVWKQGAGDDNKNCITSINVNNMSSMASFICEKGLVVKRIDISMEECQARGIINLQKLKPYLKP